MSQERIDIPVYPFYGLTSKKMEEAKKEYLEFNDFRPEFGDDFFARFIPGIQFIIYPPNNLVLPKFPYESFSDYECLLKKLREWDEVKYKQIHKGTAYYFMGWLCFQMKKYEKAVFYLDAAVSEDIRKTVEQYQRDNPEDKSNLEVISKNLISIWLNHPAAFFFTLNESNNQTARPITMQLRAAWIAQIKRFNQATDSDMGFQDFIDKFIKKLAENSKARIIITTLYSFLLEFEDVSLLLQLRSKDKGSIEPFLTYLFKGGLIFETLLKYCYPQIKNLSSATQCKKFKADYFIKKLHGSAESFQEIIDGIENNGVKTAFSTAAKCRNVTAHTLQLEDVFDNPNNFKLIFEQIINAYLFICKISFFNK